MNPFPPTISNGLSLIQAKSRGGNPKNEAHNQAAQSLKKIELVTIFVGEFDKTGPEKSYADVLKTIITLFKGRKPDHPFLIYKGKERSQGKRSTSTATTRTTKEYAYDSNVWDCCHK